MTDFTNYALWARDESNHVQVFRSLDTTMPEGTASKYITVKGDDMRAFSSQKMVKCYIANTVYGLICSPLFPNELDGHIDHRRIRLVPQIHWQEAI